MLRYFRHPAVECRKTMFIESRTSFATRMTRTGIDVGGSSAGRAAVAQTSSAAKGSVRRSPERRPSMQHLLSTRTPVSSRVRFAALSYLRRFNSPYASPEHRYGGCMRRAPRILLLLPIAAIGACASPGTLNTSGPYDLSLIHI